MAILRRDDGTRVVLLDEHVLGRSSRCDTQLSAPDASARHALVYWDGESWRVRDLGSTNGTWLEDVKLDAGQARELNLLNRIRVGAEEQFQVVDLAPPLPTVLSVDGSTVCTGTHSMIVIPDEDQPRASIALEGGSRWCLDSDGQQQLISDGDVFVLDGESFRFYAVRSVGPTAALRPALRVADLFLRFRVSRDEEHVSLEAEHSAGVIDLGSRTHHYTTLTLARLREADRTAALPSDASHGWIDAQDLSRQLGATETKLSVEICRIRQQLAKAGVVDAADVIERRRGTRQLRLGVPHFEIARE